MEEQNLKMQEQRKAYIKPEVVCELELETRAGSPLGFPNPLNLPGE